MKIPGVATVLGGVTNGVAQTVRAGARLPGSAAAAVQTLASPVLELTARWCSRWCKRLVAQSGYAVPTTNRLTE